MTKCINVFIVCVWTDLNMLQSGVGAISFVYVFEDMVWY